MFLYFETGMRFLFISLLFFFYACSPTTPNLFRKQSLHQQYSHKLEEAGLKETALGRLWFTAAQNALTQPIQIAVPYKQVGYFAADKPRSMGLYFTAKRGQKLSIILEKKPSGGFAIYADLWKAATGRGAKLLLSMDTAKTEMVYEVDEDGPLVLRLQPELLQSGEYTLTITTAPTLQFPVAGKGAKVGSVWGDARDNGARQHEGIDIFAPFRTPALAAADGVVRNVAEGGIGGKVIWLRPEGKAISLYYAHLDEQLVQAGQPVKAGDTVGLVGNTGNARSTPPHLHFGIYAMGGAVDPLPFVNPVIKKPAPVQVNPDNLRQFYRLQKDLKTAIGIELKKNTVLLGRAADAANYIGELPDGTLIEVPGNNIQLADNQLVGYKLSAPATLLEAPFLSSPKIMFLEANTLISTYGYYQDFMLVKTNDKSIGWLLKRDVY